MASTTVEEVLKHFEEHLNDAIDRIRVLEGQSFAYQTLCQMAMNTLRELPEVKGSVIDETLLLFEGHFDQAIKDGDSANKQIWGAAKNVIEHVRVDPEPNWTTPKLSLIDGGKPDE